MKPKTKKETGHTPALTPPPKQAWEELEDTAHESNMEIRYILRPVLLFMTLTGNFGYSCSTRHGDSSSKCAHKSIRTASLIYRFLVFLTVLATMCRYVSSIFFINSNLVTFAIVNISYSFQATFFMCLMFKTFSYKHGTLHRFFDFWDDKIVPTFTRASIKLPVTKFRRKQKIGIVMMLVINLTNLGGAVVMATGVVSPDMETFYAKPFSKSIATLTFHVASFIGTAFAWLSPQIFVCSLCSLLTRAFEAYVKTLKQELQKKISDLGEMRRIHLDLSKAVDILDKGIKWFFAILFAFGIFQSCFCVYQMLNVELDIVSKVMVVFWAVMTVASVAVVAGFAAWVHEAAHSPLDCVFYFNVSETDGDRILQLNLFLTKLTGTQVGFTVLGLLVITKEFLLTMGGAFLTYFFILYTL